MAMYDIQEKCLCSVCESENLKLLNRSYPWQFMFGFDTVTLEPRNTFAKNDEVQREVFTRRMNPPSLSPSRIWRNIKSKQTVDRLELWKGAKGARVDMFHAQRSESDSDAGIGVQDSTPRFLVSPSLEIFLCPLFCAPFIENFFNTTPPKSLFSWKRFHADPCLILSISIQREEHACKFLHCAGCTLHLAPSPSVASLCVSAFYRSYLNTLVLGYLLPSMHACPRHSTSQPDADTLIPLILTLLSRRLPHALRVSHELSLHRVVCRCLVLFKVD